MHEKHSRSLAKGVSYRVFGSAATVGISFIITGNVTTSLSIGGLDLIFKIFLYYFHERAWLKISWGKHKGQNL